VPRGKEGRPSPASREIAGVLRPLPASHGTAGALRLSQATTRPLPSYRPITGYLKASREIDGAPPAITG